MVLSPEERSWANTQPADAIDPMAKPVRRPKVAAPEPPALTMPPTSRRERTKCSKATAIAVTALPRSPLKTAASPCGWWRATSRGCTLAGLVLPLVDRSTVTTRRPSLSRQCLRYKSSRPLVSKVPAT